VEPVAAGGARLLLVADPGYGAQTETAFADWAPARTDYRRWADDNDVALGPAPLGPRRPPARRPWLDLHLPRTDWPWFRAARRDTLDADEFALADRLYLQVVHAVRSGVLALADGDDVDHDAVRDAVLRVLVPLLDDLRSRAQGIVALRAAQAALVPAGILLRAEIEPFLQTLADSSHRPPALAPEQWRSLRTYRDPWRPVAAALQLSGMTQTCAYALTSWRRHRRAGTTRPGPARHRDPPRRMGVRHGAVPPARAADGDPLFDMGASAMAYARRALRNDLGIAIGSEERSALDESLTDTWLRTVRRSLAVSDIR
jgi:hypothetical protein